MKYYPLLILFYLLVVVPLAAVIPILVIEFALRILNGMKSLFPKRSESLPFEASVSELS